MYAIKQKCYKVNVMVGDHMVILVILVMVIIIVVILV